jgi:hypothetical protein
LLPVSGDGEVRWTETERRLDEEARTGRRSLARERIDALRHYKDAFRRYRKFFVDRAVHTAVAANAAERYEDGVLGSDSPTTQQLLDAFGGTAQGDEAALALAVRCLEGGSRFVAVGCGFHFFRYSHDLHADEDVAFSLYVRDAQLLAGASFALKRFGLSDKVLVVALSEMARSPFAGAHYNAAKGTDHGLIGLTTPGGMHGSSRQSVLLAHGPVKPRREAYAAEPEFGDPIGSPCITGELLGFLAECAGVEREDHPWSVSPDGAPLDADTLGRVLVS